MDKELRRRSRVAFNGPGFYIPLDSLHQIVTPEAVRGILPSVISGIPPDSFHRLAEYICGGSRGTHERTKSYRKIFSILILIGRLDKISDFVQEEVTDATLPFWRVGTGEPIQLACSNDEEPIRLFREWKARDVEAFESTQWQTLAPFFSGSNDDSSGGLYQLSWKHPLPFEILPENANITKSEGRPTSSGSPTSDFSQGPGDSMKGAHGKVWKVRIHPGQHSLPSYRVRGPLFNLLTFL